MKEKLENEGEGEGSRDGGVTKRRLAIGSGVMFDSLRMSMSRLKCIECQPGESDNPRVPKIAAISQWVVNQIEKVTPRQPHESPMQKRKGL